jgi:hypothetical protein
MSLKLRLAQKEMEQGELAQVREKIKDLGFNCEISVNWTTFSEEIECNRAYNYAYSDVYDCLRGDFKTEPMLFDAFNSGVNKIELCASTTENKTELTDGTLTLTVNLANNNCVSAHQLKDFLMENL